MSKYFAEYLCCCLVTQPCPIVCDPMDCSLPGSSVHGIFQARVLELVAISYSWLFIVYPVIYSFPKKNREKDNYKVLTWSILAKGKRQIQFSSVTQSCPTLCDPMNHSTPGLPVHHQLLESTQTHVHQVNDGIQPSHLLLFPFSSSLQSFPASESFLMSQLFTSRGQSIGVSVSISVLP